MNSEKYFLNGVNVSKKTFLKDFNNTLKTFKVSSIIKLYNLIQQSKNKYNVFIKEMDGKYYLKLGFDGYFEVSENSIYNFITYDKFINFVENDIFNIIDYLDFKGNDKDINEILNIYDSYMF